MVNDDGGSDVEAGFAKLQGEDFEYYMQTYTIMLGRNSKKSTVDVDLSSLGGGMNISRHHARIFYDFQRRRFALEVLGKNGCFVEGVLHLPETPPVKLDSQDLLQIGDKEFYFLLPIRSILGGPIGPRQSLSYAQLHPTSAGRVVSTSPPRASYGSSKKGSASRALTINNNDYFEEDNGGGEDTDIVAGKRIRRSEGIEDYRYGAAALPGSLDRKVEGRSRVDRESENQQFLQLEEKEIVSSVATVLSDLCGPGEWMAMEKLHSELREHYGSVWHQSCVRRYLTCEDYPEAKGKAWYGLLILLRKYPQHFVINTKSKGRLKQEFVSLVSLLS
ncbi:FHA domain-containing protein FHA2-like [Impatiens glandulifera]|uniref:FHA domain-containing protein FHA2-like n=1 Tax=Impatiens glandulifera TaxID=253017 RepID=UPI001FB0BBC0|nr:FHA domain-containing protein FHA2-like [Impatiens glandulifera]